MKARILTVFVFLATTRLFAQDDVIVINADADPKPRNTWSYVKFDISTPLRDNPYRDEVDPETGETGYWFLPDGLSGRVGFGYNFNDFFTIGGATGIDWKSSHKIVTMPVFAEARLSPRVGDEIRLYLTGGFGHAFAIGRGNLSGNFQKYAIGIGNDEGSFFFIELSVYDFPIHEMPLYGSLSLGVSFSN